MSVVRDTFGHMNKNNFGMSCFKEPFFHMQKKQIVMSNLLNLNGYYHKEIFHISICMKNCGLSKLFFSICPYMFSMLHFDPLFIRAILIHETLFQDPQAWNTSTVVPVPVAYIDGCQAPTGLS